MEVVYKKPVWEKLNDAIGHAKDNKKTIDYIILTTAEMLELCWYCGAIGCRSFTCDSYGGVTLMVAK